MYCANCGVRLADTEQKCPLCGTAAYHPDIQRPAATPLYPNDRYPVETVRPKVAQVIIMILFLLPQLTTLVIDLQVNRQVTWSGYVAGALALCYVVLALPGWFQKANPAVFVPCDFAAAGLYLLYINHATGGNWFWSFALPIVVASCLILTTVVALLRHLRRGKLYVYGGGCLALGFLGVLVEWLIHATFGLPFIGWSAYPMLGALALGGFLVYLGANRAAREMMERKLFI